MCCMVGRGGEVKTDALLAEATRFGHYPDYKCLFLRRTYPQLSEVIERAHRLYKQLGWKWEGESRLWRSPAGGFIQFGHLQHETDKYNYIGKEFHRIIYDQVERFTLSMFQEVNTTLRTTNPNIQTQVLASANPGGVGHVWCKNMWIDRCRPVRRGEKKMHNETFNVEWWPMKAGPPFVDDFGETWEYHPALVFDNPQLMNNDPKYVRKLLALPYERREAYLWGNWDIFVGQFFSSFRRDIHVLTMKQVPKIPLTWDVYGGCDYATSGWYFSGAAAVNHDGEIIIVDEDYFLGGSLRKKAGRADKLIRKYPQMKKWAAAWDMYNELRDRDTEQVHGRIIDRFQHYMEEKVNFVKAPKDRVGGWELIKDGLSWSDGDKPWLYIRENCKKLIETIPAQIYSDTDSEDLDKDGWCHGVDFLRYIVSVIKREKKKMPIDIYDVPNPKNRKPTSWLLK